jgi:hypothetical protein
MRGLPLSLLVMGLAFSCMTSKDEEPDASDDDWGEDDGWDGGSGGHGSPWDGCSQTCDKLYGPIPACGDASGEAGSEDYFPGFNTDGRTRTENLATCNEACDEAMSQEGEVGDYDPYSNQPHTQAVKLNNAAQAQLWGECIADHSCLEIADGYCSPVW